MPNLENFHVTSSILNFKSLYLLLCIQSGNNKKKLLPCYQILNCKYFKVATKQNIYKFLFFLICKKEVYIWGFTIGLFDFLQVLFSNNKKTKFLVQIFVNFFVLTVFHILLLLLY